MEIRQDDKCFVCGPGNPGGLQARFETDAGTGSARCRLIIPPGFQGWQDIVHGGIVAALLDEAAIYACRSGDEHLVTAELTVRYRQPVPVGREVLVQASVTETRRRVFRVRSRLEIDGTVHAEAEARVVRI